MLAEAKQPLHTNDDSTPALDESDILMLKAFLDGGYIDGTAMPDARGRPSIIFNMTISVAGHQLLDELNDHKWSGFRRRVPVWQLILALLVALGAAAAALLKCW